MGGRGPAPKPAATRVRRNRPTAHEPSSCRQRLGRSLTARPIRPTDTQLVGGGQVLTDGRGVHRLRLAGPARCGGAAGAVVDHRGPQALAEWRVQCREYGLTPIARRSLAWEIRPANAGSTPARPTRRSGASVLSVLTGKPLHERDRCERDPRLEGAQTRDQAGVGQPAKPDDIARHGACVGRTGGNRRRCGLAVGRRKARHYGEIGCTRASFATAPPAAVDNHW